MVVVGRWFNVKDKNVIKAFARHCQSIYSQQRAANEDDRQLRLTVFPTTRFSGPTGSTIVAVTVVAAAAPVAVASSLSVSRSGEAANDEPMWAEPAAAARALPKLSLIDNYTKLQLSPHLGGRGKLVSLSPACQSDCLQHRFGCLHFWFQPLRQHRVKVTAAWTGNYKIYIRQDYV